MDELSGHRQPVIQGQQKRLTQGHHDRLLGRTQRGMMLVWAVRGIFRARTLTPFGNGVAVEVVPFGQLPVAHRRGLRLQFQTDGRRRAGVFVQVRGCLGTPLPAGGLMKINSMFLKVLAR